MTDFLKTFLAALAALAAGTLAVLCWGGLVAISTIGPVLLEIITHAHP